MKFCTGNSLIRLLVIGCFGISLGLRGFERLPDGGLRIHDSGEWKVFELEQKSQLITKTLLANTPEAPVLSERGKPFTQTYRRLGTSRLVVKLQTGTDSQALARAVGATTPGAVAYAPGYFVFTAPSFAAALEAAEKLRNRPGVLYAEPILAKSWAKRGLPNDPLFSHQWHLLNTGQHGATPGVDVNITNVWPRFTGKGIVVNIVDDGLQYTHPDLADNVLLDWQHDYRDGDEDVAPITNGDKQDSHGTAVAGVVAARGNNGIGVVGAAYEASLVGVRLIGGDTGDDQDANAIAHSNSVVHISNNSWGPDDTGYIVGGVGSLALAALENGVSIGRGGKGTIFVWAAGNGGLEMDNANYDGFNSSIYTVSVGALNDQGRRADYSERGACLLVSAPSGLETRESARRQGTTTTDLLGDAGYNRGIGIIGPFAPGELADTDYTQAFNGTSSSAPLVSGVVALVLQANPNLGWRDLQEVLLRSAVKNDPGNAEWFTNAAGLHFNHNFGAGMVNADAAVKLALSWTNLPPQTNAVCVLTNLTVSIPDGDTNGTLHYLDFYRANLRVESVRLAVDIPHVHRGDLIIDLISPAGTISHLAEVHNDTNVNFTHTFKSVMNWGESSQGVWRVRVADARKNDATGMVKSLALTVYGTGEANVPHVYDNFRISAWTVKEGAIRLSVTGPPMLPLQIEGSFDLQNWTALYSTNTRNGKFDYSEALLPDDVVKYYRVTK